MLVNSLASGVISTPLASTIEPQSSENVNKKRILVPPYAEPIEDSKQLTLPSEIPFTPRQKITYEKKRLGRQRKQVEIKALFFYLFNTKQWIPLLSDAMVRYYKRNYVKKEGKQHEKYNQYRREHQASIPVTLDPNRRDTGTSSNRGIPTFRKRDAEC